VKEVDDPNKHHIEAIMGNVLQGLNDKLAPSAQKIEQGSFTDHDILPAVLWMLLGFGKDQQGHAERISKEIKECEQAVIGAADGHSQSVGSKISEVGEKTVAAIVELRNSHTTAFSGLQKEIQQAANDIGTSIRKLSTTFEIEKQRIHRSQKLLSILVIAQLMLTSGILVTMLIR
jgi:hypothetical protein